MKLGLELRHVEARLCRVAEELRLRQAGLILEEHVVHSPELALLLSGDGSLSGELRVGMSGQREVLEDETNLAFVVPVDRFE